jgi:predicted alpha-1,2-mannosidase
MTGSSLELIRPNPMPIRRPLVPRSRRSRVLLTVLLGVGVLTPIGWAADPSAGAAPPAAVDPTSLVNPFIGTSAGGNTFPGASLPFGMVQWSPDTANSANGAGYSYDSPSIAGYGLTQLSGAGCPAEGDVPVLPTSGPIGADPGAATAPLVHADESAAPGYYQLDAGGVTTQLTATTRSGMARFSFPAGSSEGNLLFKLSDSQAAVDSSHFRVVGTKEVEGWVTTGDFCGGSNSYTLHFDMVFNRAFTSSGSWSTGGTGSYLRFDTATAPVIEAKVGISYVSVANAILNRRTENPAWNFTAVRAAAGASWRSELDKVTVRGGGSTQQTVFYTALYHSLLAPTVFSDVNGQYTAPDGQVQRVVASQGAQYTNYSGWDTYRGEVQLEALLTPQRMSDMVTSMLNDYADMGEFPKWEEDDGEAYIMVGDPADGIIADAYAFGATRFDTGRALSDMEAEATIPNNVRPGLQYYEKDGYLPIDGTYGCCNFYGPVSAQEEYDSADSALAQFAGELGRTKLSETFAARAQNWQEVFNPATGYLQPKEASGMFEPGFSPASDEGFVEADSSVYTAMIPFDLAGVIAAEGGNQAWIKYLDRLTSSVTANGADQIQIGDEPSFDIPWEYDYAGDPARTQQVVRQIQTEDFSDGPDGLPGNDDLGAMSSWYVWSALGAYPETPGSSVVALGSPLFDSTTVRLADGKSITESTSGAASAEPYVGHLSVDGKPWSRSYLPSDIMTSGGTLRWVLSGAPTSWGSGEGDAPPSEEHGLLPALGFLDDPSGGAMAVAPGGTAGLTFGVQGTSRTGQRIEWTATTPSGSGLEVDPSSGTLAVGPGTKSTHTVTVTASPGAAGHQYPVVVKMHVVGGTALPDVVAQFDVST